MSYTTISPSSPDCQGADSGVDSEGDLQTQKGNKDLLVFSSDAALIVAQSTGPVPCNQTIQNITHVNESNL